MAFSQKFEELMENKQLAEEIDSLQTIEEMQTFFAEKGIDVKAEIKANSTELSEEELEEANGGMLISTAVVCVMVGIYVGRTAGIALRRAYDGIRYKNPNATYTINSY